MKLHRWVEDDPDDGQVEMIVVSLLAGESLAELPELPADAVFWQAYCRSHGEQVDLTWRRNASA